MEREFTVAVFVVHRGRVLLHWHRRLARWLPPGGHIDAGELPDEAAVRETLEETGLAVELVDAPWGAPRLPEDVQDVQDAARPAAAGPWRLTQPLGIQLEDISPGHQHIDLIFLARPIASGASGVPRAPAGALPPALDDPLALRAEVGNPRGRPGWFLPDEWRALPVTDEIDRWASAAVDAFV